VPYCPEELTAKLREADVLFWRSCQDRNSVCRHIADETRGHDLLRLSTVQHRDRTEPWTVQHFRASGTTSHPDFLRFPKPAHMVREQTVSRTIEVSPAVDNSWTSANALQTNASLSRTTP
jgi:hypothetical protein